MAKRTDHPLKTLVLLAMLAAVGWLAYEFIYVRRILQPEAAPENIEATLESLHDALEEHFKEEPCILEVHRPLYRPREGHYRVNVVLDLSCQDVARDLCKDIADFAGDQVDHGVSVYAYSNGGTLMKKWID